MQQPLDFYNLSLIDRLILFRCKNDEYLNVTPDLGSMEFFRAKFEFHRLTRGQLLIFFVPFNYLSLFYFYFFFRIEGYSK